MCKIYTTLYMFKKLKCYNSAGVTSQLVFGLNKFSLATWNTLEIYTLKLDNFNIAEYFEV